MVYIAKGSEYCTSNNEDTMNNQEMIETVIKRCKKEGWIKVRLTIEKDGTLSITNHTYWPIRKEATQWTPERASGLAKALFDESKHRTSRQLNVRVVRMR